LDAADSSTVSTSGGFVTAWTDKSVNARSITPVSVNTITTSSQNSLTTLNFGTNRMTNASFAWRSIFTMIVVAKAVNGDFLVSQGESVNGYTRYVFTGNSSLLRIDTINIMIVADSVISVNTPVVALNQYFIFILGRPASSNFGSPYRVNGTARATTTDPDVPSDATTTASLWLNGNWSTSVIDTSEVAEVLYYSESLSTSQCQQIEGYLAWKWGLQGNLPTNHPFRLFPPSP
jgi:hypothetical protein